MELRPELLVGHTLTSVTASWHEYQGQRSATPIHIWLSLGELGTFQLHTLDGLHIYETAVYEPGDMGEYGAVVVVPESPRPLSARVGARVDAVSRLWQDPPAAEVGMLLHFAAGAVGIADLGDELVVAPWPGEWANWNVSLEANT